jgi:hypothetical protein
MRGIGIGGMSKCKNGGSATGYGESLWENFDRKLGGYAGKPGVTLADFKEVLLTNVEGYVPPTLIATDIDPAGRDKEYFADIIIKGGTMTCVFGSNEDVSNPQQGAPFRYDVITQTHESFVGHGFEGRYPSIVKQRGRTYPSPLFPFTSSQNGPTTRGQILDLHYTSDVQYKRGNPNFMGVQQSGSFGEGFASYGEIMNIQYGLYAGIDIATRTQQWSVGGLNVDYLNLISGISSSSRLSARCVWQARMNYPPLSLPLPTMYREFAETIGFVDNFIVDCLVRFIGDWSWQQTTYAIGLLATFGVVNKVKTVMKEKNLLFSDQKFNTWRFINASIFGDAFDSAAMAEIDKGTFTK